MAHTATEDCMGVAKVDSGAPQICVIMGGRAVLVTGTGCSALGTRALEICSPLLSIAPTARFRRNSELDVRHTPPHVHATVATSSKC